ncbi:tRNA lysidine(34) synthetase TilS [Kerstersia gyiorum]|uniref:tRNA(Ile)-lysidine synthase n=1 Tax=Kerstersia gyiorum TaxID=206506 RepID=A0A4Q7N2G0_9BURK|nr:tRNA lysidine(34) synthetase TilS [Kerstersia gyiorum]MCO7639150.1 tRNA lysidine(34) synthetase TilS [Pseudomonas sp. S 311-6]KAB0542799.1 tRNA lysidine(34) synthetase TilS [Kerstersia gyiorum]MCP1633614.1 tRNA(Ile)-lysidine synthase [Kerstersia gyiorum]MCP1637130.1 tRNA(Ile)-lysidine synthase [Kerstersia gyiorum]MCP1672621.1 tRNA(Ile)-lysidine synthase [Kerstersia gyiorum]
MQAAARGSSASAANALTEPLRVMLAGLSPGTRIAVGLSGGPDSFALACCAAPLAQGLGLALHGFHVHHGLLAQADAWAAQARALGVHLGCPVHVARVDVTGVAALGMEAAAREARYAALADLASTHGVGIILLAHHQDDQAETVLLRLLRGTGPEGLAAMARQSERGGLAYWRPWLDVPRSRIVPLAQACAEQYGVPLADDPSNLDPRYTRAALRVQLAPVLDERWRGWRSILARHARLAAQQAEILAEVAHADLQALELAEDGSFALARWRELSTARQAHVFRYWLQTRGAMMPTEARLNDMLRQLRQLHALGHDRKMSVRHGEWVVSCVRGRVRLLPHE